MRVCWLAKRCLTMINPWKTTANIWSLSATASPICIMLSRLSPHGAFGVMNGKTGPDPITGIQNMETIILLPTGMLGWSMLAIRSRLRELNMSIPIMVQQQSLLRRMILSRITQTPSIRLCIWPMRYIRRQRKQDITVMPWRPTAARTRLIPGAPALWIIWQAVRWLISVK